MDIIHRLRQAHAAGKTIVLLDYDTNADVENATKPLSHAALVKAYAEGLYPYEDIQETIPPAQSKIEEPLFDDLFLIIRH